VAAAFARALDRDDFAAARALLAEDYEAGEREKLNEFFRAAGVDFGSGA
jgi:hypothetical protein